MPGTSPPANLRWSKSPGNVHQHGVIMRLGSIFLSLLGLSLSSLTVWQPNAGAQEPTVAQAVDKVVAQEQAEVQALRQYSPLVETYIQLVRPDKELGAVPDGDRYFLGRAELAKGVELEPLIANGSTPSAKQTVLSTLT